MRSAVAIASGLVCLATAAHADPRADIVAKTSAAMTRYDEMDYEVARRLLYQALALAKQAKLEQDPVVARVYLDLALAQLAGSDLDAARLSLLSAAQIDPAIAIDPAYKSPELVKLLDEAKASAAAIAVPAAPPSSRRTPSAVASAETEDPIRGAGVVPPAPTRRFAIQLSGGSGVGYLTGKTEANNDVRTCCLGASGVVLGAEIGYRVTLHVTLAAAARVGLPLGANVTGHATVAPAGFVRARYQFGASGDGLRVMGELGGGFLRSTLDVDGVGPSNAAVTDLVAQGPLLLGAGVGYSHHIAGNLAFVVDLAAIAGIAVVDELGGAAHLNTGVSADLSVGVALGF